MELERISAELAAARRSGEQAAADARAAAQRADALEIERAALLAALQAQAEELETQRAAVRRCLPPPTPAHNRSQPRMSAHVRSRPLSPPHARSRPHVPSRPLPSLTPTYIPLQAGELRLQIAEIESRPACAACNPAKTKGGGEGGSGGAKASAEADALEQAEKLRRQLAEAQLALKASEKRRGDAEARLQSRETTIHYGLWLY